MESFFIINNALKKNGFEAYLVGGCVRDAIMGIEPHDYDFITNAKPQQIKDTLRKEGIPFTTIGEKFGTIEAHVKGEIFEITTYRKEGSYEDSRHPLDVSFVDTVKEDLARRDFTMNAIAYDIDTGDFVDPYRGIIDIQNKTIRCVGNANERLKEDPLRIARALRFAITHDFDIAMETYAGMLNNTSLLRNISKERRTSELRKMLTSNKPVKEWFDRCDFVVFSLIPCLEKCNSFPQNKWHKHDVYKHILNVVDGCDTNKFEIKLAALLHDVGKPGKASIDSNGMFHFYGHPKESAKIASVVFFNDLSLSKSEAALVEKLVRLHDEPLESGEMFATKFVCKYGIDFVRDFVVLRQSDRDDHNLDENKRPVISLDIFLSDCEKAYSCLPMKVSDLAITGKDLISNGWKQGPEIGEILASLLGDVQYGRLRNNKSELLSFLLKGEEELEFE